MAEADDTRRHLLFKGLAGGLLGFPLSLWLSWVLMYGGRAPSIAPARDQVSMWLVVPLWCAVMGLAFLATSRARLLLWLGAANLLAFAAWRVLQ
mgnify:CR=1 FL=1